MRVWRWLYHGNWWVIEIVVELAGSGWPYLDMGTLDVVAGGVFRLRGVTPPFLPRPRGIPEVTRLVTLGTHFLLWRKATNWGSFALHSATAMIYYNPFELCFIKRNISTCIGCHNRYPKSPQPPCRWLMYPSPGMAGIYTTGKGEPSNKIFECLLSLHSDLCVASQSWLRSCRSRYNWTRGPTISCSQDPSDVCLWIIFFLDSFIFTQSLSYDVAAYSLSVKWWCSQSSMVLGNLLHNVWVVQ